MAKISLNSDNGSRNIYQFFLNSEHQKDIKWVDGNTEYLYSPTNQDRIITKDFLDSTGTYVQLRAVQIIPYNEDEVFEEDVDTGRVNSLLLFAQSEPAAEEPDNLVYIGAIEVDSDFKLNSVQYIVDSLGSSGVSNLQEYLGDDYNDLFFFEYDDFSNDDTKRTVIFGNEGQYNLVKKDKREFSCRANKTYTQNYQQRIPDSESGQIDNEICYIARDIIVIIILIVGKCIKADIETI
jgi:hypothetical protein